MSQDNAITVNPVQLSEPATASPQTALLQAATQPKVPQSQLSQPEFSQQQIQAQQLMAQLHDIKAPEPVSIFPLPLAANLILLLVIAIVVSSVYALIVKYKKGGHKRIAFKKLHTLELSQKTIPQSETIISLIKLTKSFNLSSPAKNRDFISQFDGGQWFINIAYGSKKYLNKISSLENNINAVLYSKSAIPLTDSDINELFELCHYWIKTNGQIADAQLDALALTRQRSDTPSQDVDLDKNKGSAHAAI